MHQYIADLSKHVGQKVELKGWVYNSRSSGKIKFYCYETVLDYVSAFIFVANVTLKPSKNLPSFLKNVACGSLGLFGKKSAVPADMNSALRALKSLAPHLSIPLAQKNMALIF